MPRTHPQLCKIWWLLDAEPHRDAEIWLDPRSYYDLMEDGEAVNDGSIRMDSGRAEWRGIPVKVVKRMMPTLAVAAPVNEPIPKDPPEIVIEYRNRDTGRCVYLEAS